MSTAPAPRVRVGWLLRGYVRPELSLAGVLFVVVLAVMGLELALPLFAGTFIDRALAGEPLQGLRQLAIWFVLAALGYALGRVGQAYLAERLALNTTNRLRADLTRHCLRLDPSFHHEHRPGELVERIEGDVGALGRFFSTLLVTLVGNGILLVGILVTLYIVDWRLGLLLTGLVVVISVVLRALRGRATPMWTEAMQADADQSGFIAEQLAATEDIRSSGAVPYALRGFTVHARDVLARSLTASRKSAAVERVVELLFMVGMAAGLGMAAWLVLYQGATVATIYLVYRYVDLLGYPIYRINNQLADLQRATAAIGRIAQLFAHRPAVADGPGVPREPGAPTVELAGVTFGYDRDHPVLHDVSFTIPAGGRLGIVGRSGSGKTTITRLLLRFADPDTGVIRLDGADLRDLTVADVRRRVGLVTQDVEILHVSLRDNVTLFDPAVPDSRVVDVLAELGLGPLLASLPDGLDTVLPSGDGGLSAGEAQLLSLARVFLQDPQLVVLDEATSRLDSATERRIHLATDRLLQGRTALVIAHRLATIERMDRVVLIEDGRVAEAGDRAGLAADQDSRFAELLRLDHEWVAG